MAPQLIFLLILHSLLAGAAMTFSSPSHAQDINVSEPPPDEQTLITREEWLARVEAARERLRLRRAQGLGPGPAKSDRDVEQENSERVMSDDLLKPGDIVSTNQGLLKFRGQSGEHRNPEQDFVPAQR